MAELSSGHANVLGDLRALEKESENGIEIVQIIEPSGSIESLIIELSIDCGDMPVCQGGIRLRARERFLLLCGTDFPLNPPSIFAKDRRFAFHDHVYWMDKLGVYLCIYYSAEHQWHPSHGITGFFSRFFQWLEAAASGTLDALAQPLHPPLAAGERDSTFFVARADCPLVSSTWSGYAVLERRSNTRMDIVGWSTDYNDHSEHTLAPAILLNAPFVSEFPQFVGSLFSILKHLGIEESVLAGKLMVHAKHSKGRPPMYLVLGVAMRGIVGGRVDQHLFVWRIADRTANELRNLARRRKAPSKKSIDSAIEKGAKTLSSWKESTDRLQYCEVYEDRPGIVQRRDYNTSAAWFRGKTVTLWGVGALGSPIAEHLVRAGIHELRIVDNGTVKPGILIRQNYRDTDIGSEKVDALKVRLNSICSETSIIPYSANVLFDKRELSESLAETDLLIDATGSRRVALTIDKIILDSGTLDYPIATVANDLNSRFGAITITAAGSPLGPTDLLHRAYIRLCDDKAQKWLDAFWPIISENDWFEPELGCSSPTFRGSSASAGALAGSMLSQVAEALSSKSESLFLCGSSDLTNSKSGCCFEFSAGELGNCIQTGFEIRFFSDAASSFHHEIERHETIHSGRQETGGILYGFRDDFLRIVWVVDASAPPPDSQHSESAFVCGIEGVGEATAMWQKRTSGLVSFLGTWHSHPVSAATPSVVDLDAMGRLLSETGSPMHKLLLTIIGFSATVPEIGTYMFEQRAPSRTLSEEMTK